MKGLFNYDSGLFRALDKLGSLFILNLLTLVCSIPLITAGVSFTALYYVTMKMVRDEETYVTKDFFRSFKQNFRQGTVIWLILLAIGTVLFVDYRIMAANRDTIPVAGAFMVFSMICAVFLIVETAYVFPVLAKFYNTIRQTMKNAMLMGISSSSSTARARPAGRSGRPRGQSFLAPLYVCLGFAVPAYANSYLFVKIFDQYIPVDETAETGSDEEFILRLQNEPEEMPDVKPTEKDVKEKEQQF